MSYKKIPPFKWFVLQNFPFIEVDFDAITNYELLCKIVEYLNKTITATNDLGKQVEDLNNWFNNLDVQDEVNNKLDEMAESGQLTELITEYLNLKSIIAFNTVAEMKVATNLIDGSFCKTYGKITYNDGLGEFYKIRTITNDDIVDETNIIALTNNDTLVAELIKSKKIEELEEYKKTHEIGGTISPSYMGDFFSNYQFGCVARKNNLLYCINPHNYDDMGDLRIFDLERNVLLSKSEIKVGHANSIAYDDIKDCFYIAPMSEYENGVATPIQVIYKYNSNFTNYETILMPERIYAVSYDSITQCAYAISIILGNTMKLYRMTKSENNFTLFSEINYDNIKYQNDNTVFQDMAINDNVLYLAKPEGTIYIGLIKEEQMTFTNSMKVSRIDSGNRWRYGEFEGLEFDNNNHLYCANCNYMNVINTNYHSQICLSYVTELNYKYNSFPSNNTAQTIHGTLTLSEETVNKFKLGNSEIRSLNQLAYLIEPFGTVLIPANNTINENSRIKISQNATPFTLQIDGEYICEYMNIDAGMINFLINGTLTINTLAEGISVSNRCCLIMIRNRGTISMPNSSNQKFIVNGYSPTIVAITEMNNPTTMLIGDVTVSSIGMLMGNTRIYGTLPS